MIVMPETVIRILDAGGSVRIDQGMFVPQSLKEMAGAAARGGGRLTIKVKTMIPDVMTQIAAAGRGHVEFDFTEMPESRF